MNCPEVRRHWHLYHDSEGDADLHWGISQHLDRCSACAQWFAGQSRFEQLLADKLSQPADDHRLWEQVLAGAGLVQPATGRRWLIFSTLAACAAALLMLAAPWLLQTARPDQPDSLSRLVAAWHDRLSMGSLSVPFASESDLEVEDYLLREVSFPVRCPPRKDSGFAVQGAGTCRLGGQPAAYVVGHVEQTPVLLFILSRESLAAFPHQQAELGREAIHRCREGRREMAVSIIDRNLVLVVGQVPQDRLTRVLQAYGSYPHRS